uniref:Uncharacterized protein n=1 Tax=Arundo donax TaxID=35708 RepID=A0A0A9HPW6_ARUDO
MNNFKNYDGLKFSSILTTLLSSSLDSSPLKWPMSHPIPQKDNQEHYTCMPGSVLSYMW